MSNQQSLILLIVLAVVFVISSGVYTIDETEQVIITQFGRPVGEALIEPGLRFKLPFIQVTNRFDNRFLEWDGAANQVPTRDKRFIWVDTYARWRISNALTYMERLRGDENTAQSRLDDILDGETRNAIARNDLLQVVRTSNRQPDTVEGDQEETGVLDEIQRGRADIANDIRQTAAPRLAELGLELVDFQLKRINYVAEVQQDVFARMIAERQRIAQQYRSEGEGEAARIRGERQRDLQSIQSEAYRQAQETQGVADAEASRVYADAYSRDGAFYEFSKSMETFETAIDPNTLLILTTDNELFQYLNQP